MKQVELSPDDLNRIIEMAWEDRTPFEAIYQLFDINEKRLKEIMRTHLNTRAYLNWRARVNGRQTKHLKIRHPDITRGHCKTQYKTRGNKKR